ncbi:MAG: cyclodeaminase/cyclohydrolase family protein, partial [Synergistales bacterium]|nr:cyclodeaminase/cyclohydrolase family protein [Synergistales bacterium]
MKNILTHESCENFSELLAAKISVPGGGGAAALVGALGAALCSMAGNFTLGKKKYAEFEEDIKKILTKAEKIRLRLLELVNEDAEAFTPLAEAYAIPKDDPERGEILEKALLNACKAPLEMIEQCAEVINLLEEMLTKGSRLLISDVGCGALLSRAAMESAAV